VKLGELIETLQDFRANTIGVEADTQVEIRIPGAEAGTYLDDVKVEITMSRGWNRKTETLVILEGQAQ